LPDHLDHAIFLQGLQRRPLGILGETELLGEAVGDLDGRCVRLTPRLEMDRQCESERPFALVLEGRFEPVQIDWAVDEPTMLAGLARLDGQSGLTRRRP
jgi:hypothetical protein